MFYFDKRGLYIMLLIMALSVLPRLLNPANLLVTMLTIPGVLIAITFHEFAHGYAATKLGDSTPKDQGRLSLNPLAHMDPIGTFMLLFAGFGWGKPVEVNPRNYNRTIPMARADAIVSIAGPLMNFILAILFTIIYFLIIKFVPVIKTATMGAYILLLVKYIIAINVGLGVFNLIPLPPLDGSKILKNFLSYNARNWFESRENIFYLAFIVLWISGLLSYIISPVIGIVQSGIFNLVGVLF